MASGKKPQGTHNIITWHAASLIGQLQKKLWGVDQSDAAFFAAVVPFIPKATIMYEKMRRVMGARTRSRAICRLKHVKTCTKKAFLKKHWRFYSRPFNVPLPRKNMVYGLLFYIVMYIEQLVLLYAKNSQIKCARHLAQLKRLWASISSQTSPRSTLFTLFSCMVIDPEISTKSQSWLWTSILPYRAVKRHNFLLRKNWRRLIANYKKA